MNKNILGHVIIDQQVTPSNTNLRYLTESESIKYDSDKNGNKPRLIAEGIMQTANEKNRNGLWYRKDILFNAIKAPRLRTMIGSKGGLRGEDSHPVTKDLERIMHIEPTRCCVKFLDLWVDGNDVWGRFKGTFNDRGDEFDADLRDGYIPSWSLRAVGSMEEFKEGGITQIGAGKDLTVVTYDHVYYPSHPNAVTKNIIREAVNINNKMKDGITVMTESCIIQPVILEQVADYIKDKSINIKKINESFGGLIYETLTVLNENAVEIRGKDGNRYIINMEKYITNAVRDFFI